MISNHSPFAYRISDRSAPGKGPNPSPGDSFLPLNPVIWIWELWSNRSANQPCMHHLRYLGTNTHVSINTSAPAFHSTAPSISLLLCSRDNDRNLSVHPNLNPAHITRHEQTYHSLWPCSGELVVRRTPRFIHWQFTPGPQPVEGRHYPRRTRS